MESAGLAQQDTLLAITHLIGTLSMKITAIFIGYFIVKLGHDTLVRGITGELDFGFSKGSINAKLKSASPGAAFVLAGAAIIIWALAVEKPFSASTQITPQQQASVASQAETARDHNNKKIVDPGPELE